MVEARNGEKELVLDCSLGTAATAATDVTNSLFSFLDVDSYLLYIFVSKSIFFLSFTISGGPGSVATSPDSVATAKSLVEQPLAEHWLIVATSADHLGLGVNGLTLEKSRLYSS
jgi:hypothetical protein